MAKPKTAPLKVTARLADGRVMSQDGIIMLDAILYHAWFIKHHPEALKTGQWMKYGSGHIGLPLRQNDYVTHHGKYYSASRGIYEVESVEIERWNKRPDFFRADKTKYLDMEKGLISDSVGRHRAYRTPEKVYIIKNAHIEWWCVGHKDEVEEMLSFITFVGKKNSIGYGGVRSWIVEDVDEDYSVHHPEYGLMRPMPKDELELDGYAVMQYATKPPYYKKENQVLCYVPV